MIKDFRIYAARADEVDEGWIWLDSELPTRTVVRVDNPRTGRHVYCQSRQLDRNYIRLYNVGETSSRVPSEAQGASPPRRYRIEGAKTDDVIVMSQWYREALGIRETTRDREDLKVTLRVLPDAPAVWWDFRSAWWYGFRATSQHPDITARVGTRLGVIGVWLGLISLVPFLLATLGVDARDPLVGQLTLLVALVGALLAVLACRGISRVVG